MPCLMCPWLSWVPALALVLVAASSVPGQSTSSPRGQTPPASRPPAVNAPAAVDDGGRLGRKIADFSLRDVRGAEQSLAALAEGKPAVIVFLGTECPLARQYVPRLAALAREYASRGVAFVGISSNQQDSPTELAALVREFELPFPLLKDVGNRVADEFRAERTPEAFVLDAEHVVRYWGRIDDQYGIQQGVSYHKPQPTRRDVAEALEDLLGGRPVRVAATAAPGCLIGRVRPAAAEAEVTYHGQVARILDQHCVECHRPGEIGPFALETYDDALGWGEMIREVVSERRMPPWHADPAHGKFANDARLSDAEVELVCRWVDAGCPAGEATPAPQATAHVQGWRIPQPDRVIYMADKPFAVPAEGVIDYEHFVVDPGFTEDQWIVAAEVQAGNRAVVHHTIVMIMPPGRGPSGAFADYLVAMAPGSRPMQLPPGMAKRVPAGSKLVFQMHYTPNGSPQRDRTSVGIKFAQASQVQREVRTGSVMTLLVLIPPMADNHLVTATRVVTRDTLLLSLFPHTHVRGKAFRYTARYPDGQEEILLDVPRYDFNWQNTYELAEPKVLPRGTLVRCEAYYDNSPGNLANPDPTKLVTFGDQTSDEMMIGYYDATPLVPNGPAAAPAENK